MSTVKTVAHCDNLSAIFRGLFLSIPPLSRKVYGVFVIHAAFTLPASGKTLAKQRDRWYDDAAVQNSGHRRAVCRSTGDRWLTPAGRLPDKVSSALGFFVMRYEETGRFWLE